MPPKAGPVKHERLTLAQLAAFDDIITDALVDQASTPAVYYWATIRKNRTKYSASRGIREEDVASIFRDIVIIAKDPVKAEKRLLELPGLRTYLGRLKREREKEQFRRHLRKYINIYLPDCAFEVNTTNRYTITNYEAAITARRPIAKGEAIKYLCGMQVQMTPDEEKDLDLRRRDFSIVMSSRKKAASLFLGPARFANHDCNANARLMTTGSVGMEVTALRDIKLGEEITVTYGDNYFGIGNCECLCGTCEALQRNGWAQKNDDGTPSRSTTPLSSQDIDRDGPYSFRRKRKYGTDTGSATPVTTPEQPSTPTEKQKLDETSSNVHTSPSPQRHLDFAAQPIKKEHSRSGLRYEISDALSREETENQRGAEYSEPWPSPQPSRKRKRIDKPLTGSTWDQMLPPRPSIEFQNAPPITRVYSRASLTRLSDAHSPLRERILGPASSVSSSPGASQDSAASSTDATSVCEDPTSQKQVDASVVVLGSSSLDLNPTAPELIESAEVDDSNETPKAEQPPMKRGRGRPRKNPLDNPSRLSKPSIRRSESLCPPAARKPGDYQLTPHLLYDAYAAWVMCTICDTSFVQADAYFTRAACPRCERHSKLYGFGWPKTEPKGKHDNEERITDHRTVHRFLDPYKERLVGKSKVRSVSAIRDDDREESVDVPTKVERRKRGRPSKVRVVKKIDGRRNNGRKKSVVFVKKVDGRRNNGRKKAVALQKAGPVKKLDGRRFNGRKKGTVIKKLDGRRNNGRKKAVVIKPVRELKPRRRLDFSPTVRLSPSRRAFVTSYPLRSTSNQAANALGTSPPTPIKSSEPVQPGVSTNENVKAQIKDEVKIHTNPITETYVAYGSTEELYKICASQASYTIPQALEKDGVIPKTADGEDLGVGEGWWYKELGLTPTFSTWAQITILHMHLVITRLRQFPAEHFPPWQQHLMDHFFFDAETRMLTYHNMHANMIRQRYLKDLFTQYRGSQASYDEGIVKGDAVLATALWRNLWKADENVDARKLAAAVYYFRRSLLGLSNLTDQQVALAMFEFGDFDDWEGIDMKSDRMDIL